MKTWIVWRSYKFEKDKRVWFVNYDFETNLVWALCLLFWWSFTSYEMGMTLKNKAGYIHGK